MWDRVQKEAKVKVVDYISWVWFVRKKNIRIDWTNSVLLVFPIQALLNWLSKHTFRFETEFLNSLLIWLMLTLHSRCSRLRSEAPFLWSSESSSTWLSRLKCSRASFSCISRTCSSCSKEQTFPRNWDRNSAWPLICSKVRSISMTADYLSSRPASSWLQPDSGDKAVIFKPVTEYSPNGLPHGGYLTERL